MLLRLTTMAAVFLVWVPVAQAWSWPVHGSVLQTFAYDPAHPYAGGQHRGIDIGATATGDPVVAPAGGVVSFAGSVPTNGKCVTIETADGYSVTLTHLGSIGVAKGATVAEGAVVGTVGPSGTTDFSVPYVHLGIRHSADANGYVDPLGLLPAVASPPPDQVGGSSGSVGVPAGSGSGSSSEPAPTPAPVSGPAPVAAAHPASSGGAGLVIRARASAPVAAQTVPRAAESSAARSSTAPKRRPTRAEKKPTQTASKPRRFEGAFAGPAVAGHAAAPVRAAPKQAPAFLPAALAAGPGILATLAALATGLRRRRRRDRPPAVVITYPFARAVRLRRAA